jgi:hypothetical protein
VVVVHHPAAEAGPAVTPTTAALIASEPVARATAIRRVFRKVVLPRVRQGRESLTVIDLSIARSDA